MSARRTARGRAAGPERLLVLVNSPANGDHAPEDRDAVEARHAAQACSNADCSVDWDGGARS